MSKLLLTWHHTLTQPPIHTMEISKINNLNFFSSTSLVKTIYLCSTWRRQSNIFSCCVLMEAVAISIVPLQWTREVRRREFSSVGVAARTNYSRWMTNIFVLSSTGNNSFGVILVFILRHVQKTMETILRKSLLSKLTPVSLALSNLFNIRHFDPETLLMQCGSKKARKDREARRCSRG